MRTVEELEAKLQLAEAQRDSVQEVLQRTRQNLNDIANLLESYQAENDALKHQLEVIRSACDVARAIQAVRAADLHKKSLSKESECASS